MLNNNAYLKWSTVKPFTKCASIRIMHALITNRKRPSERMVAGSVNKINNGLMNESSRERTTATAIAVKISRMCTPGNIFARMKTFTVVINIFNRYFMQNKIT